MEVIAIVRLAPGEVGFYDELTGIHFTRAKPERPIYAGMNTKNLRTGVKYGRLQLVSGTLSTKTKKKEVPANRVSRKPTPKKQESQAKKQEAVEKAAFEKGSGEITIEPKLTKEEIQAAGKKKGGKKKS